MTDDDVFSRLVSFTTDRLLLREMRMEDAEPLFQIKSDPDVTARYAEEPHHSVEQTRSWVKECIESFEKRDALIWAIVLRSNDSVIGMLCLWHLNLKHHCAEIGYELHPRYWRKGIMTEAVSPVIDYGFTAMGLNRIEGSPLAINGPSRRLLERMGFRQEGNLRQRLYHNGQFLDELYYGLLKEEWKGDEKSLK